MTTEKYMNEAFKQAMRAFNADEVPIGAVVVKDGKILARGYNRREQNKDFSSHAELIALKRAARKLGDWRLIDCDLYVTLEPCAMCAGAAINARIRKIYFGAYDLKAGCCGSAVDLTAQYLPNHKTEVEGGILQEKCSQLIKNYFAVKREQDKMRKADLDP